MAKEAIFLNNEDNILLKKAIAKILSKIGYEQSKISGILGLTQPMVSNYLKDSHDTPTKINMYAIKVVDNIRQGNMPNFQNCITYSMIQGEYLIARKNELITDEKEDMIKDMTDAFLLLKGKDISELIPKVKMNLALSKADPRDKNDIASFSGGMIMIDNKISSVNSIQFGKSRHLAGLLLYLRTKDKNIRSIMNIKYDNRLKKKARSTVLTNNFRLNDNHLSDLLIHKGDFGIEPMAYIIGKNAKDVAGKVLELI